jgi:lysophospholipase L1-like esterase
MLPAGRHRPCQVAAILLLGALLPVLAGCGRGAGPAPGRTTDAAANEATGPASPAASAVADRLYVSIGDSYAAGYQATGVRKGQPTRNGFAYQLVATARTKNYHLRLVNFGCDGATTSTVLTTAGCGHRNLGPGAAPYDGMTQAAAATTFLRQHRGQVALVTVSIGGNDVLACGHAKNPLSCVTGAVTNVTTHLKTLLGQIRAATGPNVPVVGITYPDVILGRYLSTAPLSRAMAAVSVTLFKSLFNPALKSAYQTAGETFVDVTAATGAYLPLSQTTTLSPYGKIPVPVAKVCQLTFICQYNDIHPKTSGYALISGLIVAALPRARTG